MGRLPATLRTTRTTLALLLGAGLVAGAGVAARADVPAASADAGLAFVHVEANVGGASGGHSALRVGERVYHFQLGDERLLRLQRVDWDVFRFRYNVLQNRPLKLAHLDVDAATRRTVDDRFTSVLLRQQREADALAELERDRALYEAALGRRPGVPTPAAGLFDPAGAPPPGARELAQRLARPLAAAETTLDAEGLAAPLLTAPGAAGRYREALALDFALRALREARPLADDTWVAAPGPPLRNGERSALHALQAALERSMGRLLQDRVRPDRAAPLLVALARHRAAERSLRSGRLLLVDPFPAEAPSLAGRELERRRAELAAVAERLDARVARERRAQLAGHAPHELGLARLEMLAARAREYRAGAEEGRAVREPGDVGVPRRSRALVVPAAPPPLAAAQARLAALDAERDALRSARSAEWHYDLFGRHGENCVTELGHTVNAALGDPSRALGGRIDPDAWLRFWPLVFFRDVEQHLAVTRVETLPAHRVYLQAQLEEGEDGAARLATRLRESNTVTSALYSPRDPDGSFLFFTDGRVLTRPLLGAANLLWATGDGLVGLLSAPFDRGDRLVRAGRGLLFSVPELFFVNIRKGSFDAATLPAAPGAD
jgi:hypothetical protein